MADAPAAEAKKKRSPVERAVVWGLIVALAVAVGLEYRGQAGYAKTLAAIEDALDKNRQENAASTLTLEAARELAAMSPSYSEPVEESGDVYVTARWFTPLGFLPGRDYTIYLHLDRATDDAAVVGVSTAADREGELSDRPAPAVIMPAPGGGEEPASAAGQATRPQRPGGGAEVGVGPPAGAGRPGGGGAAGGRRAARRGPDLGIITQANDPVVQKELTFTDEQKAAIGALMETITPQVQDVMSAGMRAEEIPDVLAGFEPEWTKLLGEILDPERITRLRQIALQARGLAALGLPAVQDELGLSAEQRAKVRTILRERSAGLGGLRRASAEERAEASAGFDKQLLEVLNEDQKKQWAAMLGEPFERPPAE